MIARTRRQRSGDTPAARPPRRRRRWLRRLSWVLFAVALLAAVEGAMTLLWKEPVTSFMQSRDQAALARDLDASLATEPRGAGDGRSEPVAAHARAWMGGLESGQAVARLRIPSIGVTQVVVQGTEPGELKRGPGHYPETSLPGLGRTTAIAGHRTTWGAPFRNVDDLEAGDPVTLELPYGTFEYRVTGSRIVANDDWSIIRDTGAERLVLTACHPLHSADQRIAVFAEPRPGGAPPGRI